MTHLKRNLSLLLIAIFANLSVAFAEDAIYTGYFNNKAASGYDVVAYFTENKALEGDSQYRFEYMGADWYFTSQAHLDLFKNNPEKYAPQYGGHCAWAMSRGKTAPGNAPFWTIHNQKLYLNYDQKVLDTWRADKDAFISKADKHWAAMEKEL